MFDKLKINTKFTIVLAINLLFTIIITATGLTSMQTMSINSQKSYNLTTLPLGYLNNISTISGQIRVDMRELTVTVDNEESNVLSTEIMALSKLLSENIKTYKTLIENTEAKDSKNYQDFFVLYDKAEKFISEVDTTRTIAVDGNKSEALNKIYTTLTPQYNDFETHMNNIIKSNTSMASLFSNQNETNRFNMTIMFIIICAISFLSSIIFGKTMSDSVSKPVTLIVDAMNKMSEGNIESISSFNYNNEVGKLSQSYVKVTEIIKQILYDINKLSQKSAEGIIDYRIDTSKYNGAFYEVVHSVNKMVDTDNNTVSEILTCLEQFGEGNFKADLKKFPGQKIHINDTVEQLRNNLIYIYNEITTLVHSSSQGDLTKRALVQNSKGDWNKILLELNKFVDVVSAPIEEASSVLEKFSKGDLSVSVVGNYSGQFALMKNSINSTIKSLTMYINDIGSVLEKLANNDFNVDIEIEYIGDFAKIRSSLEMIITKLNQIIKEINNSTTMVTAGAAEVTNNSELLSTGTIEQSEAVNRLTTVVSSMSSQIQSSTEKAKNANYFANESKLDAVNGNEEMQNLLISMDSIEQASNNISKIIKVIESISFQTNLLALNAAVEASRAGQHGKGFAVVAEEVRSLANRSKDAALETAKLIEESITIVQQGTGIAKTTAESLNKIVTRTNEVSEIIGDIASLSSDQLDGILEIENSIDKIVEVVKSNLESSQRGSAVAQELLGESQTLKNMLSTFNTKIS